jgi:hypothetical protein
VYSTAVACTAQCFVRKHANAQHPFFKKACKCTASLFLTIENDKRFPYEQAANMHAPIQYPKPDGQITFDVPTSLYRYCQHQE